MQINSNENNPLYHINEYLNDLALLFADKMCQADYEEQDPERSLFIVELLDEVSSQHIIYCLQV